MSDPADEQADETAAGPPEETPGSAGVEGDEDERVSSAEVEEKYDLDEFGPRDMAAMSPEEWEAVFDADAWITGEALLDRVEADLQHRVDAREVFAVVERLADEDGDRLIAYSDEGYAIVFPDGSVEGSGTVLRDVKPTVALCSMEDYEVPEPPDDAGLPEPTDVPEASGELGNLMLQIVGGIHVLAGVGLLFGPLFADVGDATLVVSVAGLAFLAIGVFLFLVVANARLSDRFRSEEYRNRLRAAGVESGRRPEFLPLEDDESEESDG